MHRITHLLGLFILTLSISTLAVPSLWATQYTNQVVSSTSDHWIDSVSNDGRIIVLEDGSVWEVCPFDRIDTSLWLPTSDITLLYGKGDALGYPHLFINTDDDETASVKRLR